MSTFGIWGRGLGKGQVEFGFRTIVKAANILIAQGRWKVGMWTIFWVGPYTRVKPNL